MKTYDVVVLGGGTAGSQAARVCHEAGLSVVMFNEDELGGLCILRGCMPTKTMLHAAHLAHEAAHSNVPGVHTRLEGIDFAAIMANKDAKVARFQQAKIRSIESAGYEVVRARARFVGPDEVEAGGERYRFTKGAVIATGSVPNVIPIPGLDEVDVWSSDDVMRLSEQPRSLAVVGSGAIGLELSQFFARIGTTVHLVSRRRLLTDLGEDFADEMERAFGDEPNLELHQPERIARVSPAEGGIDVALEGGGRFTVDGLLLATGRRPALEGLGLEAAGIAVEDGAVKHTPDLRATNPKVFVAGDATGKRLLLHVANWEGARAARNLIHGTAEALEHRLHMEVVFTDPAIATVGLTPEAARAAGREPVVAVARFPETGRAITMEVRHGLLRLVADAERGELLGVQILGPRADDLVHVISAILHYHGTAADVLEMPWYHPTLSEVYLSLAREIDSKVRRDR